jgi:hypothetical protein
MKPEFPTFVAPSWRTFAPEPERVRLPEGIAERLDAGEIVLIGARSSDHGSKGRELAASDLVAAGEEFLRHAGIDFTSIVPSVDDIIAALQKAPPVVSRRDGGATMTHHFALIDLTHLAPLKLLVATGTGHFLTEEMNQPFVLRAALEYRNNNACVFATKLLDRIGRASFALGPLMHSIESNGGVLCDERGLGFMDEGRAVTTFVNGAGSKKQAKDLPKRVRGKQVILTGQEMVNGQVPCHTSPPCPPGFGYVWLKSAEVTPRHRLLFLDNDACRPKDNEVAYGLSEVRDAEGHRVDQVENVRFALAHIGKTGWSNRRIVNELVKRKYSSDRFRARHTTASSIPVDSTHEVLGAIFANLEVYEKGVLLRSVGAGVSPAVIENCLPPDGPWAAPEDFARIRMWQQKRSEITDARTLLTFAGLKARLDGEPVVLLTKKKRKQGQGEQEVRSYRFVGTEGYPERPIAVPGSLVVSPKAWAESIVQGLMDASDVPLEAFDESRMSSSEDPRLMKLRNESFTLDERIATLERSRDALMKRLETVDETGGFALNGALLHDAQFRYNTIVEQELPEARQRERRVTEEIDVLLSATPASSEVGTLLYLVESLRDPASREYRAQWLTSLRDVAFISSIANREGRKIFIIEWSGRLLLRSGEVEVAVPFGGRCEYTRESVTGEAPNGRVKLLVEALSNGSTRDIPTGRAMRRMTPAIARELGIDRRHRLLNGCDDPRVLVTAMALLRHEHSVPKVMKETGEDEKFVRRILGVHFVGDVRGQWKKEPHPAKAAFYSAAAAAEGRCSVAKIRRRVPLTSDAQLYNVASELRRESRRWNTLRKRGYELSRCECGSLDVVLMSIPEPNGVVCATCRKDESGIVWPSDPYDRYAAQCTPSSSSE